MKKYNLEFCFKGSRTYVQGPDIFDAVIANLKSDFDINSITNIKYSAHKMLHANADMILVESFNISEYPEVNSIITFKTNEKKYHIIVIENYNKIECSNDYNEDIVRTKSTIEEKNICFQNELNDSITEIIVSMNKYFLQETETNKGKWIVTKFEYNTLVNLEDIKDQILKLELTNNFNNKLTKSTVFVNEKAVGFLYFSLI